MVGVSTFDHDVQIGGFLQVGTSPGIPARCILDVGISTSSFVALPPVATDVRDGTQPDGVTIETPIAGAIIYNDTINKLQFYNGSSWETVTSS